MEILWQLIKRMFVRTAGATLCGDRTGVGLWIEYYR